MANDVRNALKNLISLEKVAFELPVTSIAFYRVFLNTTRACELSARVIAAVQPAGY